MIKRIFHVLLTGISWKFLLFLPVWLAAMAIGLFGLWERLTTGHLLAGYGSYVPWGVWVVMYFYGAGIAGGVFITGAFGYLSGANGFKESKDLRRILVLSMAALLPALLGVAMDLGHLMRGIYVMFFSFFGSVMTVNTWLYTIFIAVTACVWLVSWRKKSGWINPLLLLGMALSIGYTAGSGLFLSAVHVQPAWHDTLMPLSTLVSAMATGCALLLLCQPGNAENAISLKLPRRILISSITAYFILLLLGLAVKNWYPGLEAVREVVGPDIPAWLPWVFGCMIPLLLLFSPFRQGWRLAGLLVVLTFFWPRLQLVLSGQSPREIPALTEAFQHERLIIAYNITGMEIRVAILLVALGAAIYMIGDRINLLITDYLIRKKQ